MLGDSQIWLCKIGALEFVEYSKLTYYKYNQEGLETWVKYSMKSKTNYIY